MRQAWILVRPSSCHSAYGFSCGIVSASDTIVDAAWNNGLGIHALVWFGFDGDDVWKTRWSALLASLRSNPKAKFVTRVV